MALVTVLKGSVAAPVTEPFGPTSPGLGANYDAGKGSPTIAVAPTGATINLTSAEATRLTALGIVQ